MRVPVELLVLACLVVGIAPGVVDRPAARGGGAPGGRRHAARRTAWRVWHGFNAPLVMSLVAMAGGIARLPACCARSFKQRRASSDAPLLHRLDGRRAVRARAGRRRRALARRALRARRHAAPAAAAVRCSSLLALLARGSRRCGRAARLGRPRRACRRRPRSSLLWLIGCACAIGAAWQAKFHRLAALTMLGGRRPRHLPHLRLVLRARSRADPARRSRSSRRCCSCSACAGCRSASEQDDPRTPLRARMRGARATSCSRSRAGAGLAALVLRDADAARAAEHLAVLPRAARCREGGGTNVVNVMLVDFRGFDTLGEITVLGVGRADGVRAAAPLPAAAREHRAAAAAARAAARRRRPTSSSRARRRRRRARLHAGARRARAAAAAGRGRGRRAPVPARPQRAGRRLRRRPGGRDRASHAVHGRRHALGRGAHAAASAALDRASACCSRARTGLGALAVRLSVPDHPHRARRRCRCSARCTCRARRSSTSACSRWWSARRC